MNPFNLEDQYQFYLEKVQLEEATMHPTQRIQLRETFMGAAGIVLLLIRDEFSTLSDEDGDRMFTWMVDQVTEFWKDRVESYEQPKPLRRLTEMTHEEFTSFFGVHFATSYIEEKISHFTSLYSIHYCIGNLGNFDTYDRLVDAGFDVTFTLDRKG